MHIIIQYNNENKTIITKEFISIHSIINQYLNENNIKEDIDNLFITFNGKPLSINFSLEKYDITNNSLLILEKKNKGGNGFFSFVMQHPFLVVFSFIIALLPIFILPMGFIPSISSLIVQIIKKSTDTLGHYLVCVLGKKTLFNRINLLLKFLELTIYFIMVYVIITIPLALLCTTLKGYTLEANPLSMCDPIKKSTTIGFILTIVFISIYLLYRFGNIAISFLIGIFKKYYYLDTLVNPILSTILKVYNNFKYIPVYIIPFIGVGIKAYFIVLNIEVNVIKMIFESISELGCSSTLIPAKFMKKISSKLNKFKKEAPELDEITQQHPFNSC